MTKFLISFDEGAMTFPESELPAVADAAHAVMQAAKDAGVWVFGGGLLDHDAAVVVGVDGRVSDCPDPGGPGRIGGFSIVDVHSFDEALAWGARFAVACRCPQEVREIMADPLV